MNYTELKQKHQSDLSAFPIFFAFSNSQLEEGLNKLNTTKENIVSVGMGGFVAKDNLNKFRELLDTHNDEMIGALREDDFLLDALVYELNNHEYCYTLDPADALGALQLKREDIKPEIFKQALQNCDREN